MAMLRQAARRLGGELGASRNAPAFRIRRASFSGERVLSEEEKAAENVYIKKMERERLEKLAKQKAQGIASEAASESTSSTKPVSEEPLGDQSRNLAVVAGIVAIVAGYFWLSSSKKEKKEESS